MQSSQSLLQNLQNILKKCRVLVDTYLGKTTTLSEDQRKSIVIQNLNEIDSIINHELSIDLNSYSNDHETQSVVNRITQQLNSSKNLLKTMQNMTNNLFKNNDFETTLVTFIKYLKETHLECKKLSNLDSSRTISHSGNEFNDLNALGKNDGGNKQDMTLVLDEDNIAMKPKNQGQRLSNLKSFGKQVSMNFSQRLLNFQAKSFTKPVVDNNSQAFTVDFPMDQLAPATLNIAKDIYHADFFPSKHYNYLGIKEEKASCAISILTTRVTESADASEFFNFGTVYRGLITHKCGSTEFTINSLSLVGSKSNRLEKIIEEFLNHRAQNEYHYYQVGGKGFKSDLSKVEELHPQGIKQMKIAVLYVLPGQNQMKDIFANVPPPESMFWKFIDNLGQKINLKGWEYYRGDFGTESDQDTYYTVWKDIEIMFHIAPWCTKEQHRRLIGNDIAVIYYHDDPEMNSFDPTPSNDLGTVPQIFCAVQPVQGKKLYRLGFFYRKNIKEFGPPCPPIDYCFDGSNLKDYLFTKLHNGLKMCKQCPPMSRLYTTPRAERIKELGDKYPKGAKDINGESIKKSKKSNLSEFVLNNSTSNNIKKLTITAISGKDLVACDSNGLSDPYIIVEIGEQRQKSQIIRKTLNPEWNSIFTFEFLEQNIDTDIQFTVMDWDKLKKDDYMGESSIPLSKVFSECVGKTMEFDLHGKTNEIVSGSIKVKFEV